ncbi:MAG: TatD family hydrolase [Paludibacter sp.]|jgi:TatD DNase family protein|nr:TatD family hydrolase [Paludibacter sp.]
MIDTHAHLYAEEFDNDREMMIQRAREACVQQIVLPNVDSTTLQRMLNLEAAYPGYCFAAIGVHPTSIDENYRAELELVEQELKHRKWIAIGEIGTDLYWDKSHLREQQEAFAQQLEWSLEYDLPVIIHVRDSFEATFEVMEQYRGKGLKGIFHSFTGTLEHVHTIQQLGTFYLGINGIVTFKNSGLRDVLREVPVEMLVLETDAPYLAPVPFRGKRNESALLQLIAARLAEVYEIGETEIRELTTKNAEKLFHFGQMTD